ncbi:ABC transporter substrate-binding protein [Pusillimonas sp. CC-YST705]|uniref:ABC transporter substrate-binding protein n=1 Tax=Mesopusillimonas faecipullorum TaxID=2755040 RepID=A0ABS8CDP2_9BURK|nr:ABC transporter substrate-binding protein [Mesopusillimonas faecipullorum]MCB5364155.1 ABC transporter substrate-binding protein [Mesopusillimonas faecipullorum]
MIRFPLKALALSLCVAGSTYSAGAWADIKVGFNVPLTGFAAFDGKSALHGAELAVARANAQGGINGEKIELIVYDDQASAKEAVPVSTRLIERDKVVGAVSGSYSAASRAAAGIFQSAGVPYVAAYTIDPSVTQAGDYVFRVTMMGEVQGKGGAKLINDLGAKRVTLVTMKNDFGQALSAGFKEVAPKFDLDIVSEYEYGLADRQFGPLVAKIKADNPEAIYASGYYFTAGPFVSQLRAAGVTAPVIGQQGFDGDKFIEIAGPAAEGVIITTTLDRDSQVPVTKAFLEDFQKAAGHGADMVGAAAYSAMSILLDGLRQTGGKGGAELRDVIAKGTYETPSGKLTFNDLHEVDTDIQVQVVKDKAWRHHSTISDPVLLAAPTRASK